MKTLKEFRQDLQNLNVPSSSERTRRAAFFATALGFDCIDLLSKYKTQFATAQSASSEIATQQYDQAVKELTAFCIFLTSLDIGESNIDSWLVKFILDSLVAADKLHPNPPAIEILKSYENHTEAQEACGQASDKLCQLLGMVQPSNATSQLKELILTSEGERRNLLKFALSETFETLDQSIHARLALKTKH